MSKRLQERCNTWFLSVRGRSTLRNPHVVFFFCVLFLKGPLFLISSWKTGRSRVAHSSQDSGHETERMHGFPSVPFYFNVIYSVTSLLLRIWIVFWPCDDCYSPSFVFAQLYFCCLKLPCIKIYKHTLPQIKYLCFTRGLGSPRPPFRPL